MPHFKAKPGDETWSSYDFPVTQTQKKTLDGLWYLLSGSPRGYGPLPPGCFYSQNGTDGAVIFGVDHRSVTVHRTGRVTSNH